MITWKPLAATSKPVTDVVSMYLRLLASEFLTLYLVNQTTSPIRFLSPRVVSETGYMTVGKAQRCHSHWERWGHVPKKYGAP